MRRAGRVRGRSGAARAAALAALLALAAGCGSEEAERPGPAPAPGSLASERGTALGADDERIGAIRVSVETGVVNGAGTDRPVLVWFDNVGHPLAELPARAFAPGERVTATLSGSGLPRTLGELRRASILLTVQLDRAAVAVSWYCAYAGVEVRLEGSGTYQPYLERREVGWLSQDEPPRRSTAFALQ